MQIYVLHKVDSQFLTERMLGAVLQPINVYWLGQKGHNVLDNIQMYFYWSAIVMF